MEIYIIFSALLIIQGYKWKLVATCTYEI